MKNSKEELERLISEKKTLAIYIFDEEHKLFTSDVEINLVIKKIEKDLYKAVSYFFDGYEFWVEDKMELFFEGNEEKAMQKAIERWNNEPEIFMDYPIIYTNLTCELYEEEN